MNSLLMCQIVKTETSNMGKAVSKKDGDTRSNVCGTISMVFGSRTGHVLLHCGRSSPSPHTCLVYLLWLHSILCFEVFCCTASCATSLHNVVLALHQVTMYSIQWQIYIPTTENQRVHTMNEFVGFIGTALPNWWWHIFFGGVAKIDAGSNGRVMIGKWMVWAQKLEPYVHQGKLSSLKGALIDVIKRYWFLRQKIQ